MKEKQIRYFLLYNQGDVKITIKRFSIESSGCKDHHFEILTCSNITIGAKESTFIKVYYTNDLS